MELRLTDIEANAVQHALNKYIESLEKSGGRDKKGVQFEEDAARCVLAKLQALSGASGA